MRTRNQAVITFPDEHNYLGRRLRRRRIDLRLKIVDVALGVGVTVRTVMDAESGERVPHHSKLELYAKVLQMDLDELVFWAEQSRKPPEYHKTGT